MKKCLFYFLIATTFFQSCNYSLRVEKKRYSKGYYLAFSKIFEKKNNRITEGNIKKPTITEQAFYKQTDIKNIDSLAKELSNSNNNLINTLIATTDKTTSEIIYQKPTSNSVFKNFEGKKRPLIDASKKQGLLKVLKQTNSPNEEERLRAIAILCIGLALILLSIPVMLYLSLLIGLIMAGVGLILLIVSLILGIISTIKRNIRKVSGNNINNTPTMVDVVYLKNGSMIRGNIIEQKINEYVKIQTKDGSIFVYNLTDILKITKEK